MSLSLSCHLCRFAHTHCTLVMCDNEMPPSSSYQLGRQNMLQVCLWQIQLAEAMVELCMLTPFREPELTPVLQQCQYPEQQPGLREVIRILFSHSWSVVSSCGLPRERWGYWRESSGGPQRWLRNWSILSRRGWEMGLFSLVKRCLKGSINEYKCTLGNDVEGARLSSEAPIERTRGKGYKLKTRKSIWTQEKKNTVKAAKHGNRFQTLSLWRYSKSGWASWSG